MRLRELVLAQETQVSAHRRRERILALLHRRGLERVRLALLLARLDVLHQRHTPRLRLRLLLRVLRGEEDVIDARALRLHVVVDVRLIERVEVRIRDVRARRLLVELLTDQLLDHGALERIAHRRRLVETLPLRLLREQLVPHQRFEQLLLPLDRVVAGAQERALLVHPPLELVRRDHLVADVRDHGTAMPLLAGRQDRGAHHACGQ